MNDALLSSENREAHAAALAAATAEVGRYLGGRTTPWATTIRATSRT